MSNKPKWLIVLPYHDKDARAASALVREAMKLESVRREDVDWLLLSRFDCAPDIKLVKEAQEKFHVMFANCSRRSKGHPVAANDMFFESVALALKVSRSRKKAYEAILFLEPDCVLGAEGWLDRLRGEWTDAQSVGCRIMFPKVSPVSGPEVPLVLTGEPEFLETLQRRGTCHSAAKWPTVLDAVLYHDRSFSTELLGVSEPGFKLLPTEGRCVVHDRIPRAEPYVAPAA